MATWTSGEWPQRSRRHAPPRPARQCGKAVSWRPHDPHRRDRGRQRDSVASGAVPSCIPLGTAMRCGISKSRAKTQKKNRRGGAYPLSSGICAVARMRRFLFLSTRCRPSLYCCCSPPPPFPFQCGRRGFPVLSLLARWRWTLHAMGQGSGQGRPPPLPLPYTRESAATDPKHE